MYRLLILPILIIDSSHVNSNSSDVIVSYAGHSEAELKKPILELKEPAVIGQFTTEKYFEETEGVVFVPNEKPVYRNEDLFADTVRIQDLVKERKIDFTDAPKEDILFISGKNNENIEKLIQESETDIHSDSSVLRVSAKRIKNKRIDCKNLDCNNTVESICGGREENGKMKYRLFLNECFYRKVNCAFQNQINRYTEVSTEYCKDVGSHLNPRPNNYYQPMYQPEKQITMKNDTRRFFSSRRSQSIGVDGQQCSHSCPVSCTEDYDPQCAVSSAGQRKVFLNHCKLDYHSCSHRLVWHRRPLSECVGGKKADMQQNKGFIGWMQRVGIVDKRGRLVLSK